MEPRRRAWSLLSELFVDTEHDEADLRRVGQALAVLDFSVEEIEQILEREVSPVAGAWMAWPGAIGPWPSFDEEELHERISAHLAKPRLARSVASWLAMRIVRTDWKIVREAFERARGFD